MCDNSEFRLNGKANHGTATLEGHTYVLLNGTKPEVRLNDKKMSDDKVFQAEFAELLDVEVPEIFKPDNKEAMFNPVYEGYIHDNIVHP